MLHIERVMRAMTHVNIGAAPGIAIWLAIVPKSSQALD
jgi:hypothetical protein